ncbi:hypothetical protein EDB83DRAFT_1848832 [Lactarius deliciosus]|nr:hypothetical protein EDB83DRAFT_1848832 [Lactarius deliciosus]
MLCKFTLWRAKLLARMLLPVYCDAISFLMTHGMPFAFLLCLLGAVVNTLLLPILAFSLPPVCFASSSPSRFCSNSETVQEHRLADILRWPAHLSPSCSSRSKV